MILIQNNEIKNVVRTNTINIPKEIPRTQSFFYMPLITYSYLIISYQKQQKKLTMIPKNVTQILSLFITLMDFIDESFENKYIFLCSMITSICEYIKNDYEFVDKLYNCKKPIINVGHLCDSIQEKILSNSIINKKFFIDFISHAKDTGTSITLGYIINETKIINIKFIIDVFIQIKYDI